MTFLKQMKKKLHNLHIYNDSDDKYVTNVSMEYTTPNIMFKGPKGNTVYKVETI